MQFETIKVPKIDPSNILELTKETSILGDYLDICNATLRPQLTILKHDT